MYIAILGRQPHLGMAELEQVYGSQNVSWYGSGVARIETSSFNLSRLGGSLKAGQVIAETHGDWRKVSQKIVQHYEQTWRAHEGKITLGISGYGFTAGPRDIQKTGIILKQKLKTHGVSIRLIPNDDTALSTATAHHNKLGLSPNKIELLVVADGKKVLVAESVGSQNITAYALRDQGRPKRDAFVGMLPPKLAQIMINLTGADNESEEVATKSPLTLLDPFCGTGVILQEASLLGYNVYGTDLSDKMIDYSRANLDWLNTKYRHLGNTRVHQGDAMTTTWKQPVDAVAAETYLGQPFSAPPSPAKLREVRGNCNHIIGQFLRNISTQLAPGTPLCLGVPAWRDTAGNFTHLPLVDQLESFGFTRVSLANVDPHDLLYYRDDQVVARELLVLKKN